MNKLNTKRVEVIVYRKIKSGYRYLLLKRSEKGKYPGIWQMVSGTIEEGEKIYKTALRELKEETQIEPEEMYIFPKITEFYNFLDDDEISFAPIFLVKAKTADVVISDEHSEYKWMDFHKAYKMAHWVQWKENIQHAEKILKNKILFKSLQKIELNKTI